MMKKRFNQIIPILILFVASGCFADSYYSALGLGMPRYFVSPKAVGMGGAGIGVVDRFTLNAMNPAALNIGNITTVAVDFHYENVENKYDGNKITTRNGNASGFRFVVPLKSYLKMIMSLRPLSASRYIFQKDFSNDYVTYNRLVRGSGGLNAAGLGLQYIIMPGLAVGGVVNFNFGSYNEEWKTKFSEPGYQDSNDKINSHLWGGGLQLGVLFNPIKNLGFGVIYQSSSNLRTNTQTEFGTEGMIESETIHLSYPSSLGAGVSFRLSKLVLAADFFTQFWNKYTVAGKDISNFAAFKRYGGGMEYKNSSDPLAAYGKKISYRLGGYFAQLPFRDVAGNAIKEQFISFGFGLPFQGNQGRVDAAMEIGKRGFSAQMNSQDFIIRITGSVTGGELWFQRRHQ
ncbi:MAG: hypothetical protein GWP06_18345 [Actinobacteria bacterium]|nr:hypothetical protein [Actinomycetota bacterium]